MNNWISDFFQFLRRILHFSANFLWKFVRISRQIPEKSDVCRFFNRICENELENCRKFWNQILWKLLTISIIHYYSFVSLLEPVELENDEAQRVEAAAAERLAEERRLAAELDAALLSEASSGD